MERSSTEVGSFAIARILLLASGVSCIAWGWFVVFLPSSSELDLFAPFLSLFSIPYELNRFGSWTVLGLGVFELGVMLSLGHAPYRKNRNAIIFAVAFACLGGGTFVLGTLLVAGLVKGLSEATSVYQVQVIGVLVLVTLNSAAALTSMRLLKRHAPLG